MTDLPLSSMQPRLPLWLSSAQYIGQYVQHVQRWRETTVRRSLNNGLDHLGARYAKVQRRLAEPERLRGQPQCREGSHRDQRAGARFQTGTKPDFAITVLNGQFVERIGHRVVRCGIALPAALPVY